MNEYEESNLLADVILPAQYSGMLRPSWRTPEQRLMYAVLEDAVKCYQKEATNGVSDHSVGHHKNYLKALLYREAKSWLFDDPPTQWILSCRDVCEMLEIDFEYLKKQLRLASSLKPTKPPQGPLRTHTTEERRVAVDEAEALCAKGLTPRSACMTVSAQRGISFASLRHAVAHRQGRWTRKPRVAGINIQKTGKRG